MERRKGEGDEIVGDGKAKAQLHGQSQQAIKGNQGVEIEAVAGAMVKVGGEIGALMEIKQRRFDPPQVPLVDPAVEAIARDGRGQVENQWIGHQDGWQEIAAKGKKMRSP